MTKIIFSVTGFTNALLWMDAIASACSSVTLLKSTAIRRGAKSVSKITPMPASLPIVLKITLASSDARKLIGAVDSGFNSGGAAAYTVSSVSGLACASVCRFFSPSSSSTFRISCAAASFVGSIVVAR